MVTSPASVSPLAFKSPISTPFLSLALMTPSLLESTGISTSASDNTAGTGPTREFTFLGSSPSTPFQAHRWLHQNPGVSGPRPTTWKLPKLLPLSIWPEVRVMAKPPSARLVPVADTTSVVGEDSVQPLCWASTTIYLPGPTVRL